MFKKFTPEDVSTQNQVKSSIQRGIRAKVCSTYPSLEESGAIDDILPKKEQAILAKLPDRVQVICINGEPLFFAQREDNWFPTLRLLHKYPDMMPKLRADTGAIKFVLSGANIMCPGLTSPGAAIHDEVDAETPVAIYAEGKEHAMAVGLTKMSTKDIKEINKGIAVENVHCLNDGLWKNNKFV